MSDWGQDRIILAATSFQKIHPWAWAIVVFGPPILLGVMTTGLACPLSKSDGTSCASFATEVVISIRYPTSFSSFDVHFDSECAMTDEVGSAFAQPKFLSAASHDDCDLESGRPTTHTPSTLNRIAHPRDVAFFGWQECGESERP